MTDTSTTHHAPKAPVETIALLAIAQHAADHGLSLFGIDTPTKRGGRFVIKVGHASYQPWLDTLDDLGDQVTRDLTMPSQSLSHHVQRPGKISTALGSVRVEIWSTMRRPALAVVGSAS